MIIKKMLPIYIRQLISLLKIAIPWKLGANKNCNNMDVLKIFKAYLHPYVGCPF